LGALAPRDRAGALRVHGARLGRLGAVAGLDHAVLRTAGQGLHAGLAAVLGNKGIAAGLVLASGLLPFGARLGRLALLHVLHRRAQLLDRHGRVLARETVAQALGDGLHVQALARFDGVATQVITQRVAELALLGRGVLG